MDIGNDRYLPWIDRIRWLFYQAVRVTRQEYTFEGEWRVRQILNSNLHRARRCRINQRRLLCDFQPRLDFCNKFNSGARCLRLDPINFELGNVVQIFKKQRSIQLKIDLAFFVGLPYGRIERQARQVGKSKTEDLVLIALE